MVLQQKRYRLFIIMFAATLTFCLLPLLRFGWPVYQNYIAMLPHVSWYGDNWNASLYGILYRLIVDNFNNALLTTNLVFLIGFFLAIAWYWQKLKQLNHTHQPFCLTLVMMLLLSPLAWVYYFPILLLPLVMSWQQLGTMGKNSNNVGVAFIWLLSFFLLDLPIAYVRVSPWNSLGLKLTFFSLYFYGLLLLLYFCAKPWTDSREIKLLSHTTLPLFVIAGFSALIPIIHFIAKFAVS